VEPDDAVKNIIAAHGGEDFWNGFEALEAEISAAMPPGIIWLPRLSSCGMGFDLKCWIP